MYNVFYYAFARSSVKFRICVFLYFMVINYSFTIKNIHINSRKWHLLNLSLSVPSLQSSSDENTYEDTEPVTSISNKIQKKNLDGYDYRTIINNDTKSSMRFSEEETALFMTEFKENFEKKALLEKLENPNIPIPQKENMLCKNNIRPASINIRTLEW